MIQIQIKRDIEIVSLTLLRSGHFAEVVSNAKATSPLRPGVIVFLLANRMVIYALGIGEEISSYTYTEELAEGIMVRTFQPGESFQVEFK